jgi:hypothetical protein
VTAPPTLLAMAGTRFDLGVAAERVRRVLPASAGDGSETLDLFARLDLPVTGAIARLVALALADGSELFIAAYAAIEVVTPREVLTLPRIVTRGAPWLDALVLDGPRPLLVIAPDRLREVGHLPETTPLW